ncbi:MAG: VCBS repeat-containing protein, partial [Flavobacteriales bacterium]|nr:VCBS repeat-containing protein [Flavobacteriales bacterium]
LFSQNILPEPVILQGITSGIEVKYGDLDSDGDLDIVSHSGASEYLVWHENLGDGIFSTPIFVHYDFQNIRSLEVVDLDGDGNLDILAGNNSSETFWFENDGNGQFSEDQLVSSSFDPVEVEFADLDNNGEQDVFILGNFGQIKLFENPASLGSLSGLSLNTPLWDFDDMLATDIDSDGDMDILASNRAYDDIFWIQNVEGEYVDPELIYGFADNVNLLEAEDVDLDGDIDILYAGRDEEGTYWMANNDNTGFSDPVLISDTPQSVNDFLTIDMDQDGDIDIFVSSGDDNSIFLFEQVDVGGFEESIVTSSFEFPRSVAVFDIDGDGELDLAGGSNEGEVIWFKNNGNGSFLYQNMIAHSEYFNNSLNLLYTLTTDISGNGYEDLIYPLRDAETVGITRNIDGNTFYMQGYLSFSVPEIEGIAVQDMDDDDDLDIICASGGLERVKWFENNGSGDFDYEHTVASDITGMSGLVVDDYDNDGDFDIVVSQEWPESGITLLKNMGSNVFDQSFDNVSGLRRPEILRMADLNNDGLKDVFYSYSYNNGGDSEYGVLWMQNDGETGFNSPQSVAEVFGHVQDFIIEDVDLDGDLDVFFFTQNSEELIGLCRNNGEGLFEVEAFEHQEEWGAVSDITLADVDGNGFPDVVFRFSGTDELCIKHNYNGFFAPQVCFQNAFIAGLIDWVDFDNDNVSELLTTHPSGIRWYKDIAFSGCIDPSACNYSFSATVDDGSCCYGSCGCDDENASNYDPDADCIEGACTYDVQGFVFYDGNNNQTYDLDDGEYGLGNQNIVFTPGGWSFWTDENGFFSANVPSGQYSAYVSGNETFPLITTLNPMPFSSEDEVFYGEIGMREELVQHSLEGVWYSSNAGYPCDEAVRHDISILNTGTHPVDLSVVVEMDSLFQSLQTNFLLDSISGNQAFMTFAGLGPGDAFTPFLYAQSPTADYIGEFLTSHLSVDAFYQDTLVWSNTISIEVELTCAYDPNDKQVFPNGYEEPHFILNDTELEYYIRFQNTGNAPATNVLVTDTIDENLDLNTFDLLGYSHSVQATLKPELRVIEFFFENIMLPDSTLNEPEIYALACSENAFI